MVLDLLYVLGPGLTVSLPTLFHHSPGGTSHSACVCVVGGTWRKIALGPAEGLSEEAMVQRRAPNPLCSQDHRVDLGRQKCVAVYVPTCAGVQALCV